MSKVPSMLMSVTELDVTNWNDLLALNEKGVPGLFVASEIFDMPDNQDAQSRVLMATLEAKKRYTPEVQEIERLQAVLYHWNADKLRLLNDEGYIRNPKPAPLTLDQIEQVFKQLKMHPHYRHQTIQCKAKDGRMISLSKGQIVQGPWEGPNL